MAGSKKQRTEKEDLQSICRNKRAFHEYEIFDTLECGIVLTGSDIPEYAMGNKLNHKPKRPRKLLLHKREIDKFAGKASQQGYTLIPLRLYFKAGRAKIEIAVARGKKQYRSEER